MKPQPGTVLDSRPADHVGHAMGVDVPPSSDLVDVSILVPTRNEVENIRPLAEAVAHEMLASHLSWELMFLDDSDDGSPEEIDRLRWRMPEIRMQHRLLGERRGGLAGAVIGGFASARGRVLLVMDGDLQHPPEMVLRLVLPVLEGDCDVAVASRYVAGASAAGLAGPRRRLASRATTAVVHCLVPGSRGVRDPLSGFFAARREVIDGVVLRPHGFKILMELLGRARVPRLLEVPFRMQTRVAESSKAGAREGLRFLRHLGRLAWPGRSSVSSVAARLAGVTPLLGILAVQAWLSVRLIISNTAFLDEATYLSAGRYLLHSWSVGHSPDMRFETYFSGAPVIYPVLGALANAVGGLYGARFLSLAFMLFATVLCYATAYRLFGRPAGWVAAGLFAFTQGTQYLGAFATFDAMALMLVALAAWVGVRSTTSATTKSLVYLVVPVLALANATKYASIAYDPIVIALTLFAVWDRHGRREAVRVGLSLSAALVAVLSVLGALAGPSYMTGIASTTLNRQPSTASASRVLYLSMGWVGAIAGLAALAVAVTSISAWRHKTRWSTVGIVAVLTMGVLVAPLNQARIHTETSLSKHVTFGAFFAAIAAGSLVAIALRWRNGLLRRPVPAVLAMVCCAAGLVPLAAAGAAGARHLFEEWPNSTAVVSTLRPMVGNPHDLVLMDDVDVARYYLQSRLEVPHWVGTFYYSYTIRGTRQRLSGVPAYVRAVDDGAFSVIALDFGAQKRVDHAVAAAIHDSGRYRWVGDFATHTIYGRGTYVVWRLKASRT